MATSKQVAEGLLMFSEKELLPALEGWRMWVTAAALVMAAERADALISGLAGNKVVAALGLIGEDGEIDVETAADALKATARKHGKLSVDVPILNITYNFTEKDVEMLRSCIQQAARA